MATMRNLRLWPTSLAWREYILEIILLSNTTTTTTTTTTTRPPAASAVSRRPYTDDGKLKMDNLFFE